MQNKNTLEENPFLEEFDSPLPKIKDIVNSELKNAYYNKIVSEITKISNN
jgi:hypothetical protein